MKIINTIHKYTANKNTNNGTDMDGGGGEVYKSKWFRRHRSQMCH
jgi:hypothetical protein